MKNAIWISVLVIVVLLIGGWMLFGGRSATAPTPEETTDEVDTFIEDIEEAENGFEAPDNQVTTEETAALEAVSPYEGSGTATRAWDGTTFVHTVAANIGDPAEGKFYEGWLVDKTPTLRFVSTGMLEKQGSTYVLSYTSAQDYTTHSDVVITEETSANGLDNKPEDHVLEGSF